MKTVLQKLVHNNSIGRSIIFPILQFVSNLGFRSSTEYWESRYATSGDSGSGSYGQLAEFKAKFLNDFVQQQKVNSVLEFGCGDGNQLSLASYPTYIGLDVSATAIKKCMDLFASDQSKSFFLYDPFAFRDNSGVFKSELCLSLDVIYHLVEDSVYRQYMDHLFSYAEKWVIIYSSNQNDGQTLAHVRHRKFTDDIAKNYPAWKLLKCVGNEFEYQPGVEQTSFASFFIYKK